MIKKTVNYVDFNGDDATDDLYFHLTEAEIVDLEVKHKGGIREWVNRVTKTEDAQAIYNEFKWLLLAAYGQRSEDGKRFVKNDQIREEFASSKAYSDLIMELLTNTDKALEFFNGIVPTNIQEEAAKLAVAPEAPSTVLPQPEEVEAVEETTEPKPMRTVTRAELQEMAPEDFQEYVRQMQAGEAQILDD